MDINELEEWLVDEYAAAGRAGMATATEDRERFAAIGKQRFIEALFDKFHTDPTRVIVRMVQKGQPVPGFPPPLPQ